MKLKRYVTITIMVILFGMISLVTNLAAPLGIIIREQFHVSAVLGLMGNFVSFAAYAVMGIPTGMLIGRIGYKKTALTAISVGFVGLILQYLSGCAGSFMVYLVGAFVAGFSLCMLNTVVNPMLNFLGGGGNCGNQLIQLGGSCNSLVGIIVPMIVGALIGEITKDTAITDVNIVLYIAMAIFLVVGIILALINVEEPTYQCEEENAVSPWKFPHFVLGAIGIFIYCGVEISIPATMNFYLVDYGIPTVQAGSFAGAFYIFMLLGRLFGVPLAARFSSHDMLSVAAVMGCVLIALFALYPEERQVGGVPINVYFLVLMGLCCSVMWGTIFNLAVEGLGKSVSMASGIFMTMVCGGGLLPLLQNVLSAHVGYIASYWMIFVCLVYIAFYASVGYKWKKKY